MAKLPDFITAENELDGQEHVYIAQGGKTRKTLLQKIKEFVIGTTTMGTTATDITGAIAEHTSQLNDIANEVNQLSNPNLLINGDFRVWQRGTSFENVGKAYTADRWLYYGSDKSSVVKEGASLKIVPDFTSGIINFSQSIEKVESLRNKTVTLSFESRASESITLTCFIGVGTDFDNATDKIGKQIVIGTDVKKSYNVSFDLPTWSNDGDKKIVIGFRFSSVPSIWFNWVKLELGDKATPFSPRPYAEELAMCQRYYEEGFIWGNYMGLVPYQRFHCPFKVVKRIVPTVEYEDPNVSGTTVSVQTDAIYQDGHNCIVSSSVGNSGTAYRFQVKYKASADIY